MFNFNLTPIEVTWQGLLVAGVIIVFLWSLRYYNG